MPREIERDGLDAELRGLSYPAVRPDAAAALSDVRLVLEDRSVNLGGTVSDTDRDVFRTPEELQAAVEELVLEPRPP